MKNSIMPTCFASVIALSLLSGCTLGVIPATDNQFYESEFASPDPLANDKSCNNCHRSANTHAKVTGKDCVKCHMHSNDKKLSDDIATISRHGVDLVLKEKEKFCNQCHARNLENLNSHRSVLSSGQKASFQSCRNCHTADAFPLRKLTQNKPSALCCASETVASFRSR